MRTGRLGRMIGCAAAIAAFGVALSGAAQVDTDVVPSVADGAQEQTDDYSWNSEPPAHDTNAITESDYTWN